MNKNILSTPQETYQESVQGHLQHLVRNMEDAIVVSDEKGGIVNYWNQGAETMFGYTSEEMVGESVNRLFADNTWPSQHFKDKPLAESAHPFPFSTQCIAKDGTIFEASFNRSLYRASPDAIVTTAMVFRDTLHQNSIDQSLRHVGKMEILGQLARGMAHDFANQLTVIIGHSELLLRENKLGKDFDIKKLQMVLDAGKEARNSVQRLQSFSKLQSANPVLVDLNALLLTLEQRMRGHLGKAVAVEFQLAPHLRKVKIDLEHATQALINLSIHAKDVLPESGTFTIETQEIVVKDHRTWGNLAIPLGTYVLVTASNIGANIDLGKLGHFFEPSFSNADFAKKPLAELSILYAIMAQCGGGVTVHNLPEVGSFFRLFFPIALEDAPSEKSAIALDRVKQPACILVVEDEEAIEELLVQLLSEQGYQVLSTSRGDLAWDMASGHKGRIDLVLTDVKLPGMSGPELSKRILSKHQNCKVIFLSGIGPQDLSLKQNDEQSFEFIQKPFSLKSLLETVKDVLAR